MTVLSDPTQEQIDASAGFDLFFVGFAGLLRILGGPIQKVDLGPRYINCGKNKLLSYFPYSVEGRLLTLVED
jgi:hypothetical protein